MKGISLPPPLPVFALPVPHSRVCLSSRSRTLPAPRFRTPAPCFSLPPSPLPTSYRLFPPMAPRPTAHSGRIIPGPPRRNNRPCTLLSGPPSLCLGLRQNAPFRQSKRETDRFRAGRPPFASSEPYSSWLFPVDFRYIGPPQNIIDADVIKIRQTNQRFRGRNPFPVFKLGEQGLLNPCFHLHGNLRVPSALTEQPQIIIHRITTNDIMSYFALDKYDIMSYTEYGFRNNYHF